MNKRQIMRDSNLLATEYILQRLNGNHVWLKPHYRYPTTTYCRDYAYKTQDVWNLLDGFCSWKRKIYGIQVKTGRFDSIAKQKRFFTEFGVNMPILLINVNKETGEVSHIEIPEALNTTEPQERYNVSRSKTKKTRRT